MKLPTIEGPPGENDPPPTFSGKLFWFAGLWVGGVVVVAGVAYALRALIL